MHPYERHAYGIRLPAFVRPRTSLTLEDYREHVSDHLHCRVRRTRTLSPPSTHLMTFAVVPRLFITQPLIRSQAGTDSITSIPTEFEPPPNSSTTPTAERSELSPEIPERPTVAVDNNSFSFLIHVHAGRLIEPRCRGPQRDNLNC
jgi:hypothetical protein